MSSGHAVTGAPTRRYASAEPRSRDHEEPRGYGWVMFSAVMIMMAGTLNIIYGIAAIANSHFYGANTHFIFSELKFWGWVVLLIGLFETCVAVGVWAQSSWARWTGVAIASLSAIAQLIFIAANPWLALAIFTLDVLVVYGLVSYGGALEDA